MNADLFPQEILGFSFVEYLIIFIGLIFAIAVGDFFLSIGRLIRDWKRVTFYWEFVLWIFILFELFMLIWYTSWIRFQFITEGLYAFFVLSFPSLVVFMIVSVFFPRHDSEDVINLKEHFLSIRKRFYLLFLVYAAVNIFTDLIFYTDTSTITVAVFSGYAVLGLINFLKDSILLRSLLLLLMFIHFMAMFMML